MTKQDVDNLVISINAKALAMVDQYKNIQFHDRKIDTPYFINAVEQIYRDTLIEVGVSKSLVNEAIKLIREGKTPLDDRAGKSTPREIADSLTKLEKYLIDRNIDLKSVSTSIVRDFMKEFHIGIDCSGFVFNLLKPSVFDGPNCILLDELNWQDSSNKSVMRASCAVFDSPKLLSVDSLSEIQLLDLLIFKKHTHMGIVLCKDNNYYLADSSMEKNGVSLNLINTRAGEIEDRIEWNKALQNQNVVIKRFNFGL